MLLLSNQKLYLYLILLSYFKFKKVNFNFKFNIIRKIFYIKFKFKKLQFEIIKFVELFFYIYN